MKALFVPLKTEYYDAFKARTKTDELRLYGARWNENTCAVGRRVRLRKGYSGEEVFGTITAFRRVAVAELAGDQQTAVLSCYGKTCSDIARISIAVEA